MDKLQNNNHRKKYNRRKKDNYKKLLLLFISTLVIVVTIGLGMVALHNYIRTGISNAVAEAESEHTHFKITKEAIPLDGSREEAVAAVEAAVEEIKEANSKYADQISDEAYLEKNNIYVKEGKDTETGLVTLTFAGDILFDSSYSVMATLRDNGGEIRSGIDPALIDVMNSSDIMMLNNEFPYSLTGTPTEGKTYTFRANPDTVRYLKDCDVDLVSLANNHAYDYGKQAFLDTLDTLSNAGIAYVGAGRNISEASAPVYYIINNMKIGFISATQIEKGDSPDTPGATDNTPGVFRCWHNKALLEGIRAAKENCDFLVVYIHWGTESTNEIDWAQEEQAPQIAEAGADLIIGDHPHVLQPISVINGVPVVYSLGNFWFNSKEIDTCLVQASIEDGKLKYLRFIPAVQSGCKTRMAGGEDATRVIDKMRSMSPKITITDGGYISY